MRRALAILVTLLALGAGAVGEKVPDLALQGLDGVKVSTTAHASKPRVYVFFATWAPESLGLLKALGPMEKALRPKGLVTAGISLDAAGGAAVAAAAKREGIEVPLFLGGPATSRALDVKRCPTTFIIDAGGVVKHRFEGPVEAAAIEAAARAMVP